MTRRTFESHRPLMLMSAALAAVGLSAVTHSAQAQDVNVPAGETRTNDVVHIGNLINAGTTNNNGAWLGDVTTNVGTINNAGTWSGNLLANTGILNNSGSWSGFLYNDAGGRIVNTGIISSTTGFISNVGQFEIGGRVDAVEFRNSANGTVAIVNGGQLTVGTLALAGTLNMQNGFAGDMVRATTLSTNGARLMFDFNGTTGAADSIIVTGTATALATSTIDINVLGGQVVGSNVTPLIQVGSGPAPTPLGVGEQALNANYQIGVLSMSDPTADYYLVQTGEGAVYLGYRPAANGTTMPPITGAVANQLRSVPLNFADQILNQDTTGSSQLNQAVASPLFGIFASGALGASWHDGFNSTSRIGGVTSNGGKSVDYSTIDSSFLAAAQFDVGKWANWKQAGLKVGAFTGYANTSVDLGSNDPLRAIGITDAGAGHNSSWLVGTYGLITVGQAYGLAIASGAWGNTDVENSVLLSTGDYDTEGAVAGLIGGVVVTAPQLFGSKAPKNVGFDMRAGLSWSDNQGDSFRGSRGNAIGRTEVDLFQGSIAFKVFAVEQFRGMVVRPFLQTALNHRFDYENLAYVGDTVISYNDGDTTVSVSTGTEFDVAKNLNVNLQVRGEIGHDRESLTANIGMKYTFD